MKVRNCECILNDCDESFGFIIIVGDMLFFWAIGNKTYPISRNELRSIIVELEDKLLKDCIGEVDLYEISVLSNMISTESLKEYEYKLSNAEANELYSALNTYQQLGTFKDKALRKAVDVVSKKTIAEDRKVNEVIADIHSSALDRIGFGNSEGGSSELASFACGVVFATEKVKEALIAVTVVKK
jgi:hypothetical protein